MSTECPIANVLYSVVEYRYPEDAKRAIHTMNKAEFMGRPVFVREVWLPFPFIFMSTMMTDILVCMIRIVNMNIQGHPKILVKLPMIADFMSAM